jgi:hypothetical protein|tara:strand:+ start:956 stop:1126 length:171 start_codon:yes stop_codon:yes gene_type:complete
MKKEEIKKEIKILRAKRNRTDMMDTAIMLSKKIDALKSELLNIRFKENLEKFKEFI